MTPTDSNPQTDKDGEQESERVVALARQSERAQLLRDQFPSQLEAIHELYYGDGWHALVTRACELAAAQPFGVRWLQIKEKFGTLRLYADLVDTGDTRDTPDRRMTFRGAVSDIQEDSGLICQACGSAGQRMRAGAVMTLCDCCGATLKAIPFPLQQELDRRRET